MNGKPKSYRAMLLAVAAAKHPELDGVDKALLQVIAMNADATTGGSSRPGNALLMSATELGWDAIHARIKKNVERGLIECTYKANTRHMASVYRVCLENPAYPDQTPNGELLIENPPEPPRPGNSTVRPEPDSNENLPSGLNRTVNESTVRLVATYRTVNPVLPSGESGLPSGLSRTTSNSTSKNQPTPQPSSEPEKLPSGRSTELPPWVVKLFFDFNQAPMGIRKDDSDGFLAAIKQHGEPAVQLAWEHFVKVGKYNGETKFPAYLFFKYLDNYLGWARKVMESAEWRNEHDPTFRQRVDESIAIQKQMHKEFWEHEPAPKNGADVDEFLAAAGIESPNT